MLSGNIISILNSASELAIIAIGMTLVTASSRGQDISVGAVAAIAGSVFVRVLREHTISWPIILLAFVGACLAGDALRRVQRHAGGRVSDSADDCNADPYSPRAGRSPYWINGGATPDGRKPAAGLYRQLYPRRANSDADFDRGRVCDFCHADPAAHQPWALYAERSASTKNPRGSTAINAFGMKILSFMMLGVCVSIAGCIGVSRMGLINHETLLLDIEMDAILAVAIGGNALSGGKFSIAGSVIGAYIIQALTITLYAMKVSSTAVKAYKAVVIIAIVALGSPVVQRYLLKLRNQIFQRSTREAQAEAYGE